MTTRKRPAASRRPSSVTVGTAPQGGRLVVTDPALRARLSPGPSPEAVARIDRLERMSARAAARLRDILLD